MNLNKVTFYPDQNTTKDADGNEFAIESSIERLRKIEIASYCLFLLKIFQQNPDIDSLKLSGEVVSEFDDNNYFDDINLIAMKLYASSGKSIEIYTIDNSLFSTEFDWDEQDETADGKTILAWNLDDYALVENRWDLMYFFKDLGRTTISLTRESVSPFLSGPIDFDVFYQVLVPLSS